MLVIAEYGGGDGARGSCAGNNPVATGGPYGGVVFDTRGHHHDEHEDEQYPL